MGNGSSSPAAAAAAAASASSVQLPFYFEEESLNQQYTETDMNALLAWLRCRFRDRHDGGLTYTDDAGRTALERVAGGKGGLPVFDTMPMVDAGKVEGLERIGQVFVQVPCFSSGDTARDVGQFKDWIAAQEEAKPHDHQRIYYGVVHLGRNHWVLACQFFIKGPQYPADEYPLGAPVVYTFEPEYMPKAEKNTRTNLTYAAFYDTYAKEKGCILDDLGVTLALNQRGCGPAAIYVAEAMLRWHGTDNTFFFWDPEHAPGATGTCMSKHGLAGGIAVDEGAGGALTCSPDAVDGLRQSIGFYNDVLRRFGDLELNPRMEAVNIEMVVHQGDAFDKRVYDQLYADLLGQIDAALGTVQVQQKLGEIAGKISSGELSDDQQAKAELIAWFGENTGRPGNGDHFVLHTRANESKNRLLGQLYDEKIKPALDAAVRVASAKLAAAASARVDALPGAAGPAPIPPRAAPVAADALADADGAAARVVPPAGAPVAAPAAALTKEEIVNRHIEDAIRRLESYPPLEPGSGRVGLFDAYKNPKRVGEALRKLRALKSELNVNKKQFTCLSILYDLYKLKESGDKGASTLVRDVLVQMLQISSKKVGKYKADRAKRGAHIRLYYGAGSGDDVYECMAQECRAALETHSNYVLKLPAPGKK
ncbi:MAG: hypothetical protein K0U23_05250 [Gammaproteobacteria bacterium]|nr:hypothetical protein [Gammaproteobacteria bacterium]